MNFTNTARMLGLRLTPVQRYACELLEARGLRFCVDFGYQNAVEKATALVVDDLEDTE